MYKTNRWNWAEPKAETKKGFAWRGVLIAAAVGFAVAFYATPSNAGDVVVFKGDPDAAVEYAFKQAREARAERAETRQKVYEARAAAKARDAEVKAMNKAADKAYAKKLADQRKGRK
jgi:hypothetical protein